MNIRAKSWTGKSVCTLLGTLSLGLLPSGFAQQPAALHNSVLTVGVRPKDGAYEVWVKSVEQPVVVAGVAAKVNHHWIRSTDYPRHDTVTKTFQDALGEGQMLSTTFSGRAGAPNLLCQVSLYNHLPYASVNLELENTTSTALSVEALRVVDALGEPKINLGGPEPADRVMAESFTEDPSVHIASLGHAPHGVFFGARDTLLYNRQSKQSLFLAALTSNRFMTLLHLNVAHASLSAPTIRSLTVDSAGTTEAVLGRDQIPPAQQVELSLPVAPGGALSSERVMIAAGPDYLAQLEAYGEAVRRLHHARIESKPPIGWWSWTAYYGGIDAGEVRTNAQWLSQHLRRLGYDWFHIDEGYEYARGEYTTVNATQFPDGMLGLGHAITNLGLKLAIWTAPFEVSKRAWIYEHHPEWLVHDAQGKPISIGSVENGRDQLYALDTTHPGAQAYLRETYRVLTREWGVRYIKLDFMDSSLIEGYFHRPHSTALEAQRLGLEIIRKTVGEHVLMDKDGSPMLNPVGIVDEGRISVDTGHSFRASKDAGPNIAARFYMNRNFYISDPDAFCVAEELLPQQSWHQSRRPLTLEEGQVAIVLAAVTGGMYEIGDDLPTLGSEPDRLALVENQDLLHMAELGRAALPLDLMTFPSQDEQPSVFFLREDSRQSMLAVFNWTEQARSHSFSIADLGLPTGRTYQVYDVLNHNQPVAPSGDRIEFRDQPPHSVRLAKLIDPSIEAAAPSITAQVPGQGKAGDALTLSASADPHGVPALGFHWEFGDGTADAGATVVHTFTRAATYTVHLSVEGIDGKAAARDFPVTITGYPSTRFDFKNSRRYVPPHE